MTQETLDFPGEVLSNLTISRLLKEKHLFEFVHSDTQSHVIMTKCSLPELEVLLSELSGPEPSTYKIDTESRKLDGLSFRAEDVDSEMYYVLAICGDMPSGRGLAVLAHESVHTALKILNDHKLPPDAGFDQAGEPLAYLVGSLVEFGIRNLFPDIPSYDEYRVIDKALEAYREKATKDCTTKPVDQ